MTRGVFNVNAHNGGITGHPLRPRANFVNARLQHFSSEAARAHSRYANRSGRISAFR